MIRKQIEKITRNHIYSEIRARTYIHNSAHDLRPVFILSTGRCGTKLISNILEKDKSRIVLHNYSPELIVESKVAYEASKSTNDSLNALLGEMYILARSKLIWRAKIKEKQIIETNNKVTFFAPGLAQFFPQARFIHIHRHPAEFIRSGISRGWYLNHPYDIGRISPVDKNQKEEWETFSQYQKIAWLWHETNSFIEEFSKSISNERILKLNFNQLDLSAAESILNFTGVGSNIQNLEKYLETPANAQKNFSIPEFSEWEDKTLDAVKKITYPLAEQYGHLF